MPPNYRPHHRMAAAAIFAAALTASALAAVPAWADDCKGGNPFDCIDIEKGSGSGGQGGSSGGGTSGPVEPPDPVGLTENEAVGFVPTEGDPPPAAPTTLDWVAVAKSSAELPAPIVHTAPDGRTYVRVRTSLWVDGFEVVRTEPIGGDGQSIQATATPVSVTWNMGEAQKKCEDAGSKEGESCNYTYKRSSAGQPAGAYQITATITWNLTWSCEGPACDLQGGDLGSESMPSQPTPLAVGEIQTNTGQ